MSNFESVRSSLLDECDKLLIEWAAESLNPSDEVDAVFALKFAQALRSILVFTRDLAHREGYGNPDSWGPPGSRPAWIDVMHNELSEARRRIKSLENKLSNVLANHENCEEKLNEASAWLDVAAEQTRRAEKAEADLKKEREIVAECLDARDVVADERDEALKRIAELTNSYKISESNERELYKVSLHLRERAEKAEASIKELEQIGLECHNATYDALEARNEALAKLDKDVEKDCKRWEIAEQRMSAMVERALKAEAELKDLRTLDCVTANRVKDEYREMADRQTARAIRAEAQLERMTAEVVRYQGHFAHCEDCSDCLKECGND